MQHEYFNCDMLSVLAKGHCTVCGSGGQHKEGTLMPRRPRLVLAIFSWAGCTLAGHCIPELELAVSCGRENSAASWPVRSARTASISSLWLTSAARLRTLSVSTSCGVTRQQHAKLISPLTCSNRGKVANLGALHLMGAPSMLIEMHTEGI